MASEEWHGMTYADLKDQAENVPARPEEQETMFTENPTYRYATVEFSGNYGFLCGQYQRFTEQNMTRDEAQQQAWAAFGVCGHTIIYYDNDGNVMGQD